MQAFENLPLRTDRLVLRPLRETDVGALFAIFSDAKVMRYWSTPPWIDHEPARAMVASDLAQTSGDHLRLGIELSSTGALVGTCTLFSISATCRRAEVGYGLLASAWGKGYMNEALHSLLDYGFGELNLNRVEADIDPRNKASERTLERLGFVREGYLRERWIVGGEVSDTVLYGLLERDWRSRRLGGDSNKMDLQSDTGQILERKLQRLFGSDADGEQARAIMAELTVGVEGERVALAALKLADSDLRELRRRADAALTDYRDILAWAEYPRQMRLGASAQAAELEVARRADAAEYQCWLGEGTGSGICSG